MQTMTPRRTDTHLALAERVRSYIDSHTDEPLPLVRLALEAERPQGPGESRRLGVVSHTCIIHAFERQSVPRGSSFSPHRELADGA